MTNTTNPTAIALIDEMIVDTEAQIKSVESILRGQLVEIKARADEALEYLDNGYGLTNTGIDQRATKVAEYVAQRTALYSNLAALRHTRTAAGG